MHHIFNMETKPLPSNQHLSEAALRLKAIIETAIDGIITIDEFGIVESINPAAAKLFGYQAPEVIGNKINMLMPSPYRQEHDDYLNRYLETRKPSIIGIGREVTGKHRDGSVFPFRLAVSEVQLGDKKIFTGIIHDLTDVKKANEEVLKLNRDLEKKVEERTEKIEAVVDELLQINTKLEEEITERHAAEKALRESERELKESLEKEKELSELKSRFVSMASHEFRTPLSTILSSIELVEAYEEDAQKPKRNKHIRRIKNTLDHLNSVLQDFLSLSKLEEGKVPLNPEVFQFDNFCHDLLDEVEGQLKAGQTLRHKGLDQDVELNLDKNCLRHILFNLLSNAIKYSEENQTIECEASIENHILRMCIQDHGIGIPTEDQKHLFTRFFRAHNVENIKGTGLGLNIVRRYVDLMEGTIEFESELGVGSKFIVCVPLSKNESQ